MSTTGILRSRVSPVIRTKQQIIAFLDEHKNSELSVREFCSSRDISYKTFYKWRQRYMPASPETDGSQADVFSTLELSSSSLFAEVHGIKIYQPVAASYLKDLAGL